jgi:Limiting CO2-inducible proteins B/C beta carbonyic anhydrases
MKQTTVAFGGVTGFRSMASHIPDGGSCIVVYGPHVGVDKEGNIGTVNRRGRMRGGACCGSAVAAMNYVKQVQEGNITPIKHRQSPIDAQQAFVGSMLLPYADRLSTSNEPMAELPYSVFDAQDQVMQQIISKACGEVVGNGKIALIGGIQINTPHGLSDYFLPLRFDIVDNTNQIIEHVITGMNRATASTILTVYPKAIPNIEVMDRIQRSLTPYGYFGSKENGTINHTLLCTSLCCDEVNRPLEQDLRLLFGTDQFSIGGLAGFAWSGSVGFGAMASHIPDEGNCFIVYGPHVGIDSTGKVGTVERKGRVHGGSCCDSAIAALTYVENVKLHGAKETIVPMDPLDAQQTFVEQMLLTTCDKLIHCTTHDEKLIELPYALFEAQDEYMLNIIRQTGSTVKNNGTIGLLGGIQINTPDGMSDYFLPLRFEIRNSTGKLVAELLQ